MSIGRIMYSKMPTKPKLSHFFGFGLPSILYGQVFVITSMIDRLYKSLQNET